MVELIHELLEKDPQDRPPTALVVMNRMKAMRVGLQRGQTELGGGLATESGQPSEASDTNVTGDGEGSAVTGIAGSLPKRTVVSHGGGRASPSDATVASRDGETLLPDGTHPGADSSEKTHFQTVDEAGGKDCLPTSPSLTKTA